MALIENGYNPRDPDEAPTHRGIYLGHDPEVNMDYQINTSRIGALTVREILYENGFSVRTSRKDPVIGGYDSSHARLLTRLRVRHDDRYFLVHVDGDKLSTSEDPTQLPVGCDPLDMDMQLGEIFGGNEVNLTLARRFVYGVTHIAENDSEVPYMTTET